ncbi:hypothetical protein [Flavilitoribacter nigricans]|uniref:Uncharacterized protein n=1 Tax=Flavilitoribacter nigricans (strain ATCC 23147 / DSM 23189 / NBRC 102662 / NCIMB 1420 / SS-2) TaxID=1122177 RepID=A0A2D0N8T1_FLAN2|nr:hypothetical protein [Flavilitoribacter nigricans]PHN04559.1 hypothetical protein CRP01_21380 [Flavilitoribacter nigricans DSM 23189 = NBRC 102662]
MTGKKILGIAIILGLIVLLWKLVSWVFPRIIALTTNVVYLVLFLVLLVAVVYGIIRLLKWCFS